MWAHSSLANSYHVCISATSRGFRRGLKGLVVYDHFNLRRTLCLRDNFKLKRAAALVQWH